MAFITVSPTSGKGNATLSVTAAKHTGRASRSGNFTITAKSDATKKATVSVTQVAAAEKCVIKDAMSPVTSKQAIPFTLSVTSNFSKLYVGLMKVSEGSTQLPSLVTSSITNWVVKVNSTSKTIPTIPSGDYCIGIECPEGATSEYVFEISGTVPQNTNAYDIAYTAFISPIKITPDNILSTPQMVSTGMLVTQATTASMSVNPTSLASISASGETKSVSVSSNDEWTVTVA